MNYFFKIMIRLFLVSTIFSQASAFGNLKIKDIHINDIDRDRVITLAENYLTEQPLTVTAEHCERSAGGLHDYYSEGDYWWPDPDNPDGPYIRRDGLTNPENFTAHRKAMRRLSLIVPALVAAYKITDNKLYAEKALQHIMAWFVNKETRMNPNLLFSQAIKGRYTGRGIGIIDTIHLVEVAQAILYLEQSAYLSEQQRGPIKQWFSEYLEWITTHTYGESERDNGNNHSTCWAMQVASFAKLTGNEEKLIYVRKMFKEVLIPGQLAKDGSYPKELNRTKPYGYMLFNLDAMAMVCMLASENNDLWMFKLDDGRGMQKSMEFMYPFILNKKSWPYKEDIMYFDKWPVRHPSLLFAGLVYHKDQYIDLWKKLNPDPQEDEIIRNYPIRQPILWVD